MDAERPGQAVAARPLFSIVMPAYGVEAYLTDAIRMIQAQTVGDWELIIVDDCSPDGSGTIARQAAQDDSRIRVMVHEENRGLSAARNTGIAAARGRYVWMPDPDDQYAPDLLEIAREGISQVEGGPDAVMFGYRERYYDASGKHLYDHELPIEAGCHPIPDSWHRLVAGFERDTQYGYAWNKVFRLDRIKSLGLAFEDVRLIEDVLFAAAFFDDARSLVVMDGMPYGYAKREGSSLTNANAYSAREYWGLMRRRVATICQQLYGWDVLDGGARAIMGSMYVRYAVSALERSYHPGDRWSRQERAAWCSETFDDGLFAALVPFARSDGSKALSLAIRAFQARDARRCIRIGHLAYLARSKAYGLFTKIRSGR